MKKFLPYILILVILTGIFNPTTKTQAQADPTGNCYLNFPSELRVVQTIVNISPESTCTSTHGVVKTYPNQLWDCVFGPEKNIPLPEPLGMTPTEVCVSAYGKWIPVDQTGPRGTCILTDKTLDGQWTEIACKQQPNFKQWLTNDAPRGTCVVGTTTNQNWTKAACDASSGKWTATGSLGNCMPADGVGPPNQTTQANCQPPSKWTAGTDTSDSLYHFLAPLPCTNGTPGCVNGKLETFDPTSSTANNNKLGEYLNLLIKIFIGICAVLAVIMIVMGGIEYMTTELVSGKEAGKERITHAIFGLLLALGAVTLLNTINPDLLKTDLSSLKDAKVEVTIKDFQISGAQSIDGKPGAKVNFKAEACPAATAAQGATGVDKALILSIFAQESGGGANTGGCSSDGSTNSRGLTANMYPADVANIKNILAGLGKSPPVNVSCAGAGGGHGGAMGGMQILPSTWIENGGSGKNPWNTADAMVVAATKLKANNGIADPYHAACKYFGNCSYGGIDYAQQVVDRMNQIKTQIAKDGC